MKTVFFVRHAKSSWSDTDLSDIDRPLNKRGLRDAPFMAKFLQAKIVSVDLIVSSPANRALTTAEFFAKAFGKKKKEIRVIEDIYESFSSQIISLVQSLENDVDSVLIFGHNPTFTNVVNQFSKKYIPNIPTCGIAKIVADTDKWKKFNEKTAKLDDYYYPKMFL